MQKLIILSILVSASAMASETFVNFGLGVFNSAKNGPGETKMYNVGHRTDLPGEFYIQDKIGFWGQEANSDGMKSSGYVSEGLGMRVNLLPVEFHAGYAIALITTPDSYLGGHFQFQGDVGLTLRDRAGNGVGMAYSHLSSAGIETPNMGRDFVVLELSKRW